MIMAKRVSTRIIAVVSCCALICLTLVAAQEFVVNTHRFDPYKQFKFRVKWDGKYIPGIVYVSGLNRKTQVVTHRSGSDSGTDRKSPGQTTYEPIALKRGRTHDTSFEQWANKVYNYGSGPGGGISLADYQKDIIIELCNEAGQTVMAFKVYRCWPSHYSALNQLNSMSGDAALETMILEHEGWERDYEVREPAEPSFTEPY
jgi:phage tail-like protein